AIGLDEVLRRNRTGRAHLAGATRFVVAPAGAGRRIGADVTVGRRGGQRVSRRGLVVRAIDERRTGTDGTVDVRLARELRPLLGHQLRDLLLVLQLVELDLSPQRLQLADDVGLTGVV